MLLSVGAKKIMPYRSGANQHLCACCQYGKLFRKWNAKENAKVNTNAKTNIFLGHRSGYCILFCFFLFELMKMNKKTLKTFQQCMTFFPKKYSSDKKIFSSANLKEFSMCKKT